MAWFDVGLVSLLPVGEAAQVQAGKTAVAVCNVGGALRALGGCCPHAGAPLGEGHLDGQLLVCPWHAWAFDVTTGACEGSAQHGVAVYPAEERQGHIWVEVPEDHA